MRGIKYIQYFKKITGRGNDPFAPPGGALGNTGVFNIYNKILMHTMNYKLIYKVIFKYAYPPFFPLILH